MGSKAVLRSLAGSLAALVVAAAHAEVAPGVDGDETSPVEQSSGSGSPVARIAGTQTTYTTRAAFDAATGATLPIEGFENGNAPPGTVADCGTGPLDAATNVPACLSPGDMLPGLEMADRAKTFGARRLAMYGAGYAGNPTRVIVSELPGHGQSFFQDPFVRGPFFGADLHCFPCPTPQPVRVQTYDPAGVLTGSHLWTASSAGVFFGVIDASDEISRVHVHALSSALAEGMDNIAFGDFLSGPR